MLHRSGPEFTVQGRPLLLELGPALLGSRKLETMIGQFFCRLGDGRPRAVRPRLAADVIWVCISLTAASAAVIRTSRPANCSLNSRK